MKYNPDFHHRRSIRKKGYDYAQNGTYFITVCAYNRACLFGEINDGIMHLNDGGKMADECWRGIPVHYPFVSLFEFMVMPNHVHGILRFEKNADVDDGTGIVGANDYSPKRTLVDNNPTDNDGQAFIGGRANDYSPLRINGT